MAETVRAILLRDLRGLERQLSSYSSDEVVWELRQGIANSAGTLILHMSGNLRHFIGAVLGGNGYVRDRDAEFSRRHLSREELRSELQAAALAIETVLPGITDQRLAAAFPVPIAGRSVRTSDFLGHLVSHLAYHLGQVDFHRRLLDGGGGGALEIVSPAELPAIGP